MKQNLLKTMLVSTALVAGTMGVWAENGNGIITSLPVATQTFDDAKGVFKGGETGEFGGSVGNVLRINKTTATATFDKDADTEGNQAYVLANNEKVTINFTAFHGWNNSGISDFKILNSDGNSLVSYKYDHNLVSISEVKIGGIDVSGFNAFACQSGPAARTGKKCDGFLNNKKQGYINDDAKNPQITITVSGNGFVSIRFVISALKIDKEFSASVGDLKTDLASISINSSVDNGDRAYAIDNFSIGTETTQEATASYTVKKMCGNIELGSETGAGIVGSTPTLAGADMWVDGKKYIYVGNDVEKKGGIAASGSTYTLTYREAATYNYSVIGKVGDAVIEEFAKGQNFEGETVKVPYHKYIFKDNVLYVAPQGNKDDGYYQKVVSLDQNELVVNVEYSAADLKNVAFWSEAEDIAGLTSNATGAAPLRCSDGKGAFAESDAVITKLSAGIYRMHVGVFGNTGTNFVFKNGNNVVFEAATTGTGSEVSSSLFKLTDDSDIVLSAAGNGGSSPKLLDYVIIEKFIGDDVAVSAVKFATYVPTCNVVVPADAKVYTAKVNEAKSAVVLTEVPAGFVIAKGTPVLVGAEAGSYNFAASAEEAATVADNDLKAATADTKGDGSTIYALVEQDGKAVFAPLKEGVAVSLGHAYLKLPAASATRFYSIQFGGETTGINEVNAAAKADGAYYTLQGVKTSKAAKGIYIHNGKKVVIK